MKRLFMAGCPDCRRSFVVDWELRHGPWRLICPFCQTRFLPDEAASLDERYRN